MTVEQLQFFLGFAKRARGASVLAFSGSDWDSDRHSESGTASWVRGKRSWYFHHGNEQGTITDRTQYKLRRLVRYLVLAKGWD